MRRSAWVLVIACMVSGALGLLPSPARAQAAPFMMVETDQIDGPNGTVVLDVTVDPGSNVLTSLSFNLGYDPSVVTPTGFELVRPAGGTFNSAVPGIIRVGIFYSNDASDRRGFDTAIVIGRLTLSGSDLTENAVVTVEDINAFALNDAEVALTAISGEVIVAETAPLPTAELEPTPEPTLEPTPEPTTPTAEQEPEPTAEREPGSTADPTAEPTVEQEQTPLPEQEPEPALEPTTADPEPEPEPEPKRAWFESTSPAQVAPNSVPSPAPSPETDRADQPSDPAPAASDTAQGDNKVLYSVAAQGYEGASGGAQMALLAALLLGLVAVGGALLGVARRHERSQR